MSRPPVVTSPTPVPTAASNDQTNAGKAGAKPEPPWSLLRCHLCPSVASRRCASRQRVRTGSHCRRRDATSSQHAGGCHLRTGRRSLGDADTRGVTVSDRDNKPTRAKNALIKCRRDATIAGPARWRSPPPGWIARESRDSRERQPPSSRLSELRPLGRRRRGRLLVCAPTVRLPTSSGIVGADGASPETGKS